MYYALYESSRIKEEKINLNNIVNTMRISDLSKEFEDVLTLGPEVSSQWKFIRTTTWAIDPGSHYTWPWTLKQKFERVKVSFIKIAWTYQIVKFSDRRVDCFDWEVNRSVGIRFFLINCYKLYTALIFHLSLNFYIKLKGLVWLDSNNYNLNEWNWQRLPPTWRIVSQKNRTFGLN